MYHQIEYPVDVKTQLGGKDPAYVREDADLNYTVSEIVDGLWMLVFEYANH
jgi:acyl-CoA reductase-like NAD-dependent aldehyde dehydrogenase